MYSPEVFSLLDTLKEMKTEKMCTLEKLYEKVKDSLPEWFTIQSLTAALEIFQQKVWLQNDILLIIA